jgi:hypothetical protein
VISITDILASLVKAYQQSLAKGTSQIALAPSLTTGEVKQKQDVNVRVLDTSISPDEVKYESAGGGGGLGSWKWAKGETGEGEGGR